jgi:hypothetical protein
VLLANIMRSGLVNAPSQIAEIFVPVGRATLLDTSRFERENLGNPCSN